MSMLPIITSGVNLRVGRRAQLLGTGSKSASIYAVSGFAPDLVADFTNEYYEVA